MARQLSAKDVTYKDTDDCVFLLSFDECVHYLAGDGANREGKADDITIWFVYPNGSAMAPVITQESLEEGEVDESFFWWLRDMQSVTNPKSNSAYIAWTETDDAGNVSTCVGSRSVELNSCLRPAIWITVDYKPELELTEMVDTSRFAGAPSEAADGNSGEGADGTTEEEAAYATLQKGDKGDAVKALQQKLIDLGYLNGKADGDYGKKTRDAVSAFQRSAGLEQTGVADGRTQAALFAG